MKEQWWKKEWHEGTRGTKSGTIRYWTAGEEDAHGGTGLNRDKGVGSRRTRFDEHVVSLHGNRSDYTGCVSTVCTCIAAQARTVAKPYVYRPYVHCTRANITVPPRDEVFALCNFSYSTAYASRLHAGIPPRLAGLDG